MVQQIVAKTDGVPLFVEELTKMVLESGLLTETNGHYELSGPLPPLAIPSTLQDSLMARLDRLGANQRDRAGGGDTRQRVFLRLAPRRLACGREHASAGVESVGRCGTAVSARDAAAEHYLFKHALIQDTAYQSLLKSSRQQLHQQIAQVLEERFPETKDTQPELLAHHYTEAGLIAQAIPYWQQAGQRASQRSAYVEAVSHLTAGLELLKTLPDTPERAQQELTLQIALGAPLMATKGYAAPEVESAYARARELCQQWGDSSTLPCAAGTVGVLLMRGELQTARELGEQLLELAQQPQTRLPPRGPPCTGDHLVLSRRVVLPANTQSKGLRSTILSSIAL